MSKNLRMQGWDFTSPGGYFVTICTKRMQPVFGTVVNGHMHLNDAGNVAEAFWREIPEHFPHVIVDEYVIMPESIAPRHAVEAWRHLANLSQAQFPR